MIQLVNDKHLQISAAQADSCHFESQLLSKQRPAPFPYPENCRGATTNITRRLSHTPVLPSFVHVFMLLHHDRVSCWDINDVPDREEIVADLLKTPHELLLYYHHQETHPESGSPMVAWRSVLLCCLGEDGCKEGLFICPRWGDTGSDPVSPIWGFADRVRVGDQRLTFIRVLEQDDKNINKWQQSFQLMLCSNSIQQKQVPKKFTMTLKTW